MVQASKSSSGCFFPNPPPTPRPEKDLPTNLPVQQVIFLSYPPAAGTTAAAAAAARAVIEFTSLLLIVHETNDACLSKTNIITPLKKKKDDAKALLSIDRSTIAIVHTHCKKKNTPIFRPLFRISRHTSTPVPLPPGQTNTCGKQRSK